MFFFTYWKVAMHNANFGICLMFSIFLIWFVAFSRTLSGKTVRPNMSGDRVVFRTPRIFTATLTMYLLLLPALGLWALPNQISDIIAEHDSLIVTLGWSAAFTIFFVAVPLAPALFLFGVLPGPQELLLNKRERTYDIHFGTYLKRRFRSGSWEDIEGILIKKISEKGSVSYGIYVAWRQGLSGGPSLGLAGDKNQADKLAKEIALELGLQIVSRAAVQ